MLPVVETHVMIRWPQDLPHLPPQQQAQQLSYTILTKHDYLDRRLRVLGSYCLFPGFCCPAVHFVEISMEFCLKFKRVEVVQ